MNRLLGIGLVAISAAAFGTLAILGRYAYAEGMDAFTILFFRFSLAAVVMFIWLAFRREPWPRRSAVLRLMGMGAIGYVGQAFSYLTALKYASSGLVALLLYLYPMFVTLLSALVLKERIAGLKWLALTVAFAGTALTVGPEGGQLLGILLALAGASIYSVYILVGSQVLKEVSAAQSSAIIFASAGVSAGTLMFLGGPHWPTGGAGWAAILAIVFIATVLPVVTFLAGLNRIGPSNASMLSTLEPVVTVVIAWLVEGTPLKPISLLGGALILGAVLLLTGAELRRAELRRPEPVASPTTVDHV